MLPASSDDFHQQLRFPDDNSPRFPEQRRETQEHEPSGKSKKKGKGSKGKDKGAKASAKSPFEELIQRSPPPQPELSPATFNPGHHTKPNVVSPVLDALGSFAETRDNDVDDRTDIWAKSVPYGKSPPTDLIDGELASHPSSASPGTRPLSYGNGYQNSSRSRQQSADRQKSNSVSSPFNNQIPLPHLPQAHFYGAPDIDVPIHSGQNRPQIDGGYSFCAFDSISSASFKASRMGGNVLLIGTDGALEVLAIEDRKARPIGKLVGLNGRVIDAKILNVRLQNDPFASSRPHVAVIVHGPSQGDDESSTGSDTNEMAIAPGRHAPTERRSDGDNPKYQTRIEVYSLRAGDHVTTLFTSKPVPCLQSLPGLPLFAPPPVGNLRLFASGNYIVLASGASGEVYIYGINSFASNVYQCLGKTWTSVQAKETRRYSASSSSTDPDGSRNSSPNGSTISENPILSLRGRWLAVVPPSSTGRTSIQGTVPATLTQGKVFGMETRSPPAKPGVTCATDVGDGESFFDRVARGVTQEFFRGARWMGGQGLQAWNNYWNKEQLQNMAPRRPAQLVDIPQGYNIFPPTHAQDMQAATSDPDSVSILDLRRLEDGGETKSALLNPAATFQVPNGCSFLSFSPSGLMLLTASKKGDVQYVWDLMQAKHCRARAFLSDDSTAGTSVRRVARYARLTMSSIVDVIWAWPSGDRLAIITRKGTVHVFDMPRSAFQWPPFRRARPPVKVQNDDTADAVADRTNGGNPLSAAIKLVGDKTQPIFAAVRGRTPSTGPGFPPAGGFGISSAAGVRGGKAVAAGLSKSMGAASGTVNTLRHVGENRLHVSGLSRNPAPSRVVWASHKGQPFLGLVDGGYFRLYRIRRALPTKSRPAQSVIGSKEMELKLPPSLQNPCGPIPVGSFSPEATISAGLALPTTNPQPTTASKAKSQPLSQAEIETNAPYQPFHTDQRVNLYTLSRESEASSSMTSLPTDPWVFGDGLSMTKLHVRPFSGSRDEAETADEQGVVGDEMENLVSLSNSTGNGEEVVITTRRKKRHSLPEASMDDGFFEDDCEVLDFARDRV